VLVLTCNAQNNTQINFSETCVNVFRDCIPERLRTVWGAPYCTTATGCQTNYS